MILEIHDKNIDEVIDNSTILMIDIIAPWCGPCKILTPIIEQLVNENADITIGKVNIDESYETTKKFNIKNVPTILFFKNGQLLERLIGLHPKSTIQGVINKAKNLN